jgi:hypothetical protein
MNELEKLSIADLKAAKEIAEKLKIERLEYLKDTDINSKDDIGFKKWEKLEFDLHNHLSKRLMKLIKN